MQRKCPRRLFIPILLPLCIVLSHVHGESPNVVMIICDDLNEVVGYMMGDPQGLTPAIDGLAESGVSFTQAYSNNPVCAPSRASFISGIYPHTSGNYGFLAWDENTILANSRTLMEHFRANGYHVAGTGKIMHHHRGSHYDEFGNKASHGPTAWDGTMGVGHPSVPEPFRSVGFLDGTFASLADVPFGGEEGKGWSYERNSYVPFHYVNDDDRSPMPDELNAQWASERIAEYAAQQAVDAEAKPFFLSVGFVKPHTPMVAPQKYFDRFPLDQIQLPEILDQDAEDTHYRDIFPDTIKGLFFYDQLGQSYDSIEEGLRHFIQAYLACSAFVDDQIKVVLEAIEANGLEDNTIVLLTSDHGWNLGQKEFLYKNSPWEESARVPFMVRAPGVSVVGQRCDTPISLIDIYPTLVDLCGLEGDTRKNDLGRPLDGFSLRPLLEDPLNGEWDGPETALTMVHAVDDPRNPQPPAAGTDPRYEHYSLRSEDFRYIRYNDGVEELYDHRTDPYEWNNLAGEAAGEETVLWFRDRLEEYLARPAPGDNGQFISVNISVSHEGNTAIDGEETFGVPSMDTVTGLWNNLSTSQFDLLWDSGERSSVIASIHSTTNTSYFGAGYINTPLNYGLTHYSGTSDDPGTSITLSNLRSNFPDGYWAVAYLAGFKANTGATITDGETTYYYQTLDPVPSEFGPGDLMLAEQTTPPVEGMAPHAQYAVFGSPEDPLQNEYISLRIDVTSGGGAGLGGVQVIAASPASMKWGTYPIDEHGNFDTGPGFLGFLWTDGESDWIYAHELGQWIYLPDALVTPGSGAWVCFPGMAAIRETALAQIDGWVYPDSLQTWIWNDATGDYEWGYIFDLSVN